MISYGTAAPMQAAPARRRMPFLVIAAAAGLACACVLLLVGVMQPAAAPAELYQVSMPGRYPVQALAAENMKAASYIDKWTKLSSPDFQGPMEILAAKKAGIPVIYPSQVVDKSGKLNKLVPSAMLRAIQKPLFNVVPASQSSKLACICDTCKPYAGFPPVCTGCTCEEAEMNDKVWFLGHTRACGEDECDSIKEEGGDEGGEEAEAGGEEGGDAAEGEEAAGEEAAGEEAAGEVGGEEAAGGEEGEEAAEGAEGEAEEEAKKNALLDFPECDTWSCYNKDGWFCACVCPGQGC